MSVSVGDRVFQVFYNTDIGAYDVDNWIVNSVVKVQSINDVTPTEEIYYSPGISHAETFDLLTPENELFVSERDACKKAKEYNDDIETL